MTELALPVLGVVFVFGAVLPTAALMSRLCLRLLQWSGTGAGLHGHGALRYALLIGPTLGPLAWIVSACLHQAEAGTAANVCAGYDPPGVLCPEVALFACALVVLVALAALPRIYREQRALRPARSVAAESLRARLQRLAQTRPALAPTLTRLVIADHAAEPIATRGVLAPRIVIATGFAAELDDAALLGALCHEAEHVRDRDPLRYFIAWWALALNPLGRWLLGSELTRWIVAREAHCDREAVLAGASAPALAQALVAAARFSSAASSPATPALRTPCADVLRLRVDLLMAYADRLPQRCCRAPSLRLAICGFVLALALAHPFGEEPLNTLHRTTEGVASFIAGANTTATTGSSRVQ